MCGIAGILTPQRKSHAEMQNIIRRMGFWQYHRGPDAWGEYITENVALGHNRLAIIDVKGGSQPMASSNGEVQVIFNGEIYNYKDLWTQLEKRGHHFRTDHSDTEVLVNGYLEWGCDLFEKLQGMFAIGIWDGRTQELILARDRMGIKPLYISVLAKKYIVFASEIKAILKSELICPDPVLCPESLRDYFLYRAPKQPKTMFKDISKIKPGTFHAFNLKTGTHREGSWIIPLSSSFDFDGREIEYKISNLLEKSIKSHLISDVPLGVFLSGGIDSSLIATFAANKSVVDFFNIGSHSELDETPFALKVADRLNIPLHTEMVDHFTFINHFDDWTYVNDDPSSDPSALALMVLAAFARKYGMKVMLSGEGGDELFGGYYSYVRYGFFLLFSKISGASFIASHIAPILNGRNRDYLNLIKNNDLRFLGSGHLTDNITCEKIFDHSFLSSLSPDNVDHVEICPMRNPLRQAMLYDQMFRLPDDILMRTDRATMFYALETRVPFLDNELVNIANSLPDYLCVKPLQMKTKYLLKRIASRYLPKEIIYRRKKGFDLPIQEWLMTSFKETIMEFLLERKMSCFNYEGIATLFSSLQKTNSAFVAGQVWAWLTMEKWYRLWVKDQAVPRCPQMIINYETYDLLKG